MVGPRTTTLDAGGRIITPGYIDPHVHPAHVVTPSGLAPAPAAARDHDRLRRQPADLGLGGLRAFRVVADSLARSPLKFYWMIRVHAQARTTDEARRFPLRDIARALEHPWSFAAGEVTRWPDVWAGDRDLLGRLDLALARGQRVEGHTAGAAADKIAALAAGGPPPTTSPRPARCWTGPSGHRGHAARVLAPPRPGRPARCARRPRRHSSRG